MSGRPRRVGRMTSIMWFRRDLRLRDHPALRAAAAHGPVLGLFVLDPGSVARRRAGAAGLAGRVAALARRVHGRPVVRAASVRPASVVPRMAAAGRGRAGARDQRLHAVRPGSRHAPSSRRCPSNVEGVATGTPYAVAPGTVANGSGNPYKVFTPFSKAWRGHGWDDPVPAPRGVEWVGVDDDQRVAAMLDKALREAPEGMPTPGEDAALAPVPELPRPRRRRLRRGPRRPRGRPHLAALARTSSTACSTPASCSPRPRAGGAPGATTFETELAWRDFYADVLFHHPASAWQDLNRVAGLTYDEPRGRDRGLEDRAPPASRSSTPGCASCSARAGCTTGCG